MTISLSAQEYRAALSRDSVLFIQRAFHELHPSTQFVLAPHIELIAGKLDACRRGEIRRLIITVPPRNLKSHCATVAFPAFLLGHDPSAKIICASYGQQLADDHARQCRQVMLSRWYRQVFPRARLAREALHDFKTTESGNRLATSVGGPLTGRGADFIILDDPLKPDEALSEVARTNTNNWYDNSVITRLNDKTTGVIIIVMQRLHQDDLVGHVLRQEEWEVVSFPAIAVEEEEHIIETPYGNRLWKRSVGGVLHPEREPLETLHQIRETMGSYNFEAQYQQCPTPPGGGVLKTNWLQYYEPHERPAKFAYILQSWDTANKPGELNDFSVCTTWGCFKDTYYLLDVTRKRLSYPDLKREVVEQYKKYRPQVVLIEDKASGTQLLQELKVAAVHGVKAYMPPAGSDKLMRFGVQSIHFENGKVKLPDRAPWLHDYIAELTGFPGARFDDQVDSTTQALDYLQNNQGALIWAKLGASR